MAAPTPPVEPDDRPVRTDLRAGAVVLAVAIGAHLLWRASETGLPLALHGR